MSFISYVKKFWETWKAGEFAPAFKLYIVWCWCHVMAYVSKNDDTYKKKEPRLRLKMKALVVVYFRWLKLALVPTLMMALLNELHCILSIEFFEVDKEVLRENVTMEQMQGYCGKDEEKENHKTRAECFPADYKRRLARNAAEATRL